jgi:hypothetical protein
MKFQHESAVALFLPPQTVVRIILNPGAILEDSPLLGIPNVCTCSNFIFQTSFGGENQ